MKEFDVSFNPEVDGASNVTLLGKFPMHVFAYNKGNEYGGSVPFNPEFLIHESAGELKGINWKEDGKEEAAVNMPGKLIKGIGLWLNPNPKTDKEKAGNARYMNFLLALNGLEIPKDKSGLPKLVEYDEAEILGFPVFGKIGLVSHKEDRDKPVAERRQYPTVVAFSLWEDGTRLDPDDVADQYIRIKSNTPF